MDPWEVNTYYGQLRYETYTYNYIARPSFVIDLSKVNYVEIDPASVSN